MTIQNVTKSQLMRDYTVTMKILTVQHFLFVQTKQRVTNRYITNEMQLNRN